MVHWIVMGRGAYNMGLFKKNSRDSIYEQNLQRIAG